LIAPVKVSIAQRRYWPHGWHVVPETPVVAQGRPWRFGTLARGSLRSSRFPGATAATFATGEDETGRILRVTQDVLCDKTLATR
jgi:hypothetical protein